MNKDTVIILTATFIISENNIGSIYNSEQRKIQYYNTLRWFLDNCDCKKYVICDNSGYDFSVFADDLNEITTENGKTIEYLSFVSFENKGKSYGETEILDFVFMIPSKSRGFRHSFSTENHCL